MKLVDNETEVVNFATSKTIIVKSTVFAHCKIYTLGLLLMKGHTIRLITS
jgi:hypothetical protein